MDRNSNRYNINVFKELAGIEPFLLEKDKILLENETQFHLLGLIIIFGGITLIFWCPVSISIFLRIIIILGLIISGSLFVRKIGSYSVLDLSNNTLYREYRFGKFIFFKWKLIELSEVLEFGITHIIGRPIEYGKDLNTLVYNIAFILAKRREYIDLKPFNPKYGGIEKTAIIYLTKNGKVGRVNKFSATYDSDDINNLFGSSLSLYANIPIKKANSYEGLIVKKMPDKYKFVTYALKPLFFSEQFISFIISLTLGLLAIAICATLLHFDLI